MTKKILVTGSSGFIGFHLCKKLLKKGFEVYGLDNFSKSYSINLKKIRTNELLKFRKFTFFHKDIQEIEKIKIKFDSIFHLAAEAGVRKSIEKPIHYIDENISKTLKVFEFAKKRKIKKIFYASSSSVYGDKGIFPTKEKVPLDQPISIYGVTKVATENIAYYYFKIFNINSIGFRFFTVFGPYGRPDMSIFIFIKALLKNKIINLNNYGNNFRDFTFIDTIIDYLIEVFLQTKLKTSFFHIFNIGGEKNINLKNLIKKLEILTKKKAKIRKRPRINLDPDYSLADNKKIKKFVRKKIIHNFDYGLKQTVLWMVNNIKKL